MFEAIEEPNTIEAVEVAQHVKTIFSKAKALKETMNELTEKEKQRRVGTRLEHRRIDHHLDVPGLREVKQSYLDNMAELETEGTKISELYLPAIQDQKMEVESRLEGLIQYQGNLLSKLDELVFLESSLNNQSGTYSQLLAQGDIAAADALEAERLGNLQATNTERLEMERKLAAAEKAETILKNEVAIYREMFITARRNLMNQTIIHVLKPKFAEQFATLQATYLEMSEAVAKLWGARSDKWEHKIKIQELLDKTGREFISHNHVMEQDYYQSLR